MMGERELSGNNAEPVKDLQELASESGGGKVGTEFTMLGIRYQLGSVS